ncbi:MAG TPA: hypothetical protein VMS22_14340 [Candidatus Eisenbacteria bacterium]|nr:hypothetical protein [Candidatus Eisenbacteria bacterium]
MRYATNLRSAEAARETFVCRGERRLMLAVLEDALRSILRIGRGPWAAAHVREEIDWLVASGRADPFAFESICDALDIDPGWLRRRVLDAVRSQTTAAPAIWHGVARR